MTDDQLLAIARRFEGRTLTTVTGHGFTVGLSMDGPCFTPASSGFGQNDGRPAAARFVDRDNATGSLRPADDARVTRNAPAYGGLLVAAGIPRTTVPHGR